MQERRDEPIANGMAEPPRSAVHQSVVLTGLISLLTAVFLITVWRPADHTLALALLLAAAMLPMLAVESYFGRRELFAPWRGDGAFSHERLDRVGIKLLGLTATYALIALCYWAFPIYRDGEAVVVWSLLAMFGIPLLLISPVYVWLTDVRMQEPRDGLYQAGLAVLGRLEEADRGQLSQYMLAWLVKGYFLPLMFSYTMADLNWLLSDAPAALMQERPYGWYQFGYRFLFFVDLLFGDVGYLCTLRLFNTHVRSTDRTGLGWAVCLACYPPFWYMIRSEYLAYWHVDWGGWFGHIVPFGLIWAALILGLTAMIVWSDASFGLRFSNLAYRGLLTNGPFRWTKHPGYLAKNVHWWLISVPFLSNVSVSEAVRHSLLLACVNALYYGRAKTEEWHLYANEPRYRAYADFIAQHGLVAILKRRVFAILRLPWRL